MLPRERAKGAKVPCPLFRILVKLIYCMWRCLVISKSLHRSKLWVTESGPLTAGALQNPVQCLWVTPLIYFNHFSHMFISRHFHQPEWIFDTLKDIPWKEDSSGIYLRSSSSRPWLHPRVTPAGWSESQDRGLRHQYIWCSQVILICSQVWETHLLQS